MRPVAHDDVSARRSRLFTVRIWAEAVEGGSERRGSVRDVATGAFCNFREWSGLTSFLTARCDETTGLTEATDQTGGRR
jgi:hypothetical protein